MITSFCDDGTRVITCIVAAFTEQTRTELIVLETEATEIGGNWVLTRNHQV